MRKSKRNAMISTFVLTLLLIVGSITDADLTGSAEAEVSGIVVTEAAPAVAQDNNVVVQAENTKVMMLVLAIVIFYVLALLFHQSKPRNTQGER